MCTEGYGTEGLYYNQPWAFDDYENFQQDSQAFTDSWNASFDAYTQAQEQARQDAQDAYVSSEMSYLQGRIDDLESRPSQRDTRTLGQRMVDDYDSTPQAVRDRNEFWRDL